MGSGTLIFKAISVMANVLSECLREDQNKDKEE